MEQDYVAKFKADVKNFIAEVEKAKRGVADFKDKTEKSTSFINKSLDSLKGEFTKMVGAITAANIVMKGFSLATDAVKHAINSTQTTQDAFNMKVEQMKGGLNEFYRTLATGDWSSFVSNMKQAIELSKDYYKYMDALGTSQNYTGIQQTKNKMEIERLNAEYKQYKPGSDEANNILAQIDEVMKNEQKQVEHMQTQYKNALDSLVKKDILNNKATAEGLIAALDETDKETQKRLQEQAAKIKDLIDKLNAPRATQGGMAKKVQKERDALNKELAEIRNSPDIITASADKILEHKNDFKEFKELYEKYGANSIKLYQMQGAFNEKARTAETAITTELKNQNAEREKANILKVKVDTTPQVLKVKDIADNTPNNPLKISNMYLSNEAVAQYDAIIQRQQQLQEAIKIGTQLYGEQSEKVRELQEELDKLTPPPDKFISFAEGLQGVSSTLDMVANSSDKIKDNPAIKALAFSLLVLNSAQQIAKTSSWVETIIAAAALATSTISFVASLSSQKFAVGGIVSPAASGDQTNIRVNPGEMILNQNQQRRLFSLIGKEQPDSIPAQIELIARGHNLVGVINNYNRKYTR